MATWRMKVKLPTFRVTQRITGARVIHRDVPRGRQNGKSVSSSHEEAVCSSSDRSDDDIDTQYVHDFEWPDGSTSTLTEDSEEPSLHKIKQKANIRAWSEVREMIRRAPIQSSAMQDNQLCINCPMKACYRCLQCAATAYYCEKCFVEAHKKVNFFHTGERWDPEVCHYL